MNDGLDPREWQREQPGYGPAWAAAIELGIDVALLEANLLLTPQERFDQLVQLQRLDDELRAARESLYGAAD